MKKAWTHGQLFLLFLVALLLFLPLRWDSGPWLQQKARELLARLPLEARLSSIQLDGLTLRLQGVHIAGMSGLSPIDIDTLRLQADWSQWLQGRAGYRLHWQGSLGQGSMRCSIHDTGVEIQDLDAAFSSSLLASLLSKRLPFPLQGRYRLQGSLGLQRTERGVRPLHADVRLTWQQAAIDFGGASIPLGDYEIHLRGSEDTAWPWRISGGEALSVTGEGNIRIHPQQPWSAWPLAGEITLRTNKQAKPLLASSLSGLQHVSLRGTLAHPVWQIQTDSKVR